MTTSTRHLARRAASCLTSALHGSAVSLLVFSTAISAASAQDVQRIAAVVNERVISVFDVQQRIQILIASSGLPNTAETQRRITPQVLRGLIDEALQTEEAERLNVRVTQGEIESAVRNIEQNNNIPRGTFETFLRRQGISLEAATDQIRANIAWQKLLSRTVIPTIEIGEEEIDTVIQRIEANRGVTEFHVGEILLPVDNPADTEEIRELANRLVKQIRNGADFRAVAGQFSKSASAATGGDIGWIQAGGLEPAINTAIVSMKVGEVSEPISTADGFTIFSLISQRTNEPPSAGERTVQLRQALFKLDENVPQSDVETTMAMAREMVAKVRGCKDFSAAAEAAGTPQPSNPASFKLKDLNTDLRAVAANLPVGQASAPIRQPAGIQIVMICERQDDTGPVRDEIRQTLLRERVDMLSRRYLRDLRRAAFVDLRV